jgi:hypothetical protein
MFGLKKGGVPDWARGMNAKSYAAFEAALDSYFVQRNQRYVRNDGMITTEDWEAGLDNLVRVCAGYRPDAYPEIIANHFGCFLDTQAFEKEFEGIVHDLDQVKSYIGVRLYDQEYLSYLGDDAMIGRRLAGELSAVLVWDFPTAITNISPSDRAKWDVTDDELFAIGIENISANYPLDAQVIDFDGVTVYAVETDHFFAPNVVFALDHNDDLIGPGGALVALPSRSFTLVCPIRMAAVLNALSGLFTLVARVFDMDPGQLTREVYWYRDGVYEPLTYDFTNGAKFYPTQAFLDMLEELEKPC